MGHSKLPSKPPTKLAREIFMKGKVINRDRDFMEFRKVLRREGRPAYLPFYEHVASAGFISERMQVDVSTLGKRDYWRTVADFWLSFGMDCIPMETPLLVKRPGGEQATGTSDTAASLESEANACVFSVEDFEKIEWPDAENAIDFEPFEIVAEHIPEGVKIVGGVACGPFEYATQFLFGLVGFSYMMVDDPDLISRAMNRLMDVYVGSTRRLAAMDCVGACRQGDDLGFKSSTFLPPDQLREWIFPIYKRMVDAAHAQDKPFVLHSCGNLAEVYEDIIDCGVDAKHSYEEQILPVQEFKKQYGKRITPIGGLDVDMICRSDEATLRDYTRRLVEECFADGHWALGSGNSITDYMPLENYLIMLDEGIRASGG